MIARRAQNRDRLTREAFELTCITGCEAAPVNTVRKFRMVQGFREPEMAYRCREHTSRFDIVLLGPGPLVGETRHG